MMNEFNNGTAGKLQHGVTKFAAIRPFIFIYPPTDRLHLLLDVVKHWVCFLDQFCLELGDAHAVVSLTARDPVVG